ncbi:MAG: glutamine--fructose-6-phosphate transaminase (isomerizing) [Chloroflexi bacterium]|nr:glutamine--fructose-6-phosphate transaminase (isomerizing) [Chloroflexota bacterium]
MCGIVGYIGLKQAQPILASSLSRLEYRGYDSCGIATVNHGLEVSKCVGTVDVLLKVLAVSAATCGIGHTRWATHGQVNTQNAHPHVDCKNLFAVVHNGIVENYGELRKSLQKEGHLFNSETDTEVIPHLIEKYYRGDLKEAVKRALEVIEGTYAIIVVGDDKRQLVCARRDSPLVIGIGDHEHFVASDVSALLDKTDRAVYLEDGDICSITECGLTITNGEHPVTRETVIVPWTADQVKKDGYAHFMLKEIHEQPRAVSETMAGRVSVTLPSVDLEIEAPPRYRNILFTACGSSYHAALIGEQLLSRLAGKTARAVIASEFDQIEATLNEDWVIGITQSGETADTLRSLKKAKAAKCSTMAVVNVQGSTATRLCDQTLLLRAGPEISVAATKTFMAQLTSMYLLALSPSINDSSRSSGLISEMKLLPERLGQILDREDEIAEQAVLLSKYSKMFVVARGLNCPVALEGALKIKEISYVHAEAHPAGELKHGPFALLGQHTPVIALAPIDDTYQAMKSSIKEIKSRGSPLLAIIDERDSEMAQISDNVIRVPTASPLFSPMLNTLVLQLLSYYIAKMRGCPIDRPANLAKSVTVL